MRRSGDQATASRLASWLPPFLLVVVTAAVMLPAAIQHFGYDDSYVIARLHSPLWSERLFAFNIDRPSAEFGAWYDGVHLQRRFVRVPACLLMAAELAIIGLRPRLLHTVGLVLHLANALLVYGLASRWLR